MKNIILFIFTALILVHGFAQSPFSNETNSALEKVIRDYPFQFQNIKDRVLLKKDQTTEYGSKITIPEALGCHIVEHQLANIQTISWQANMYQSNDFTSAGKVFKQLYTQIKNTIVKLDNEKPIILNGSYETPSEKNASTSVFFDLLPATNSTQKLKVDLSMIHSAGKWKIILSVYDGDKKGREQTDVVSSNGY
jgi:hypothetical protein